MAVTTTTVEHVGGHYEVQETPYARSYVWRPERVTVECECGGLSSFTSFETAFCRCGLDHTGLVREELTVRRVGDEEDVPWREESERTPERSEYHDWVELNELD